MVLRYQVRYYPRSQTENEITENTQVQNLTITEFMLDTDYEFLVSGPLGIMWRVGEGGGGLRHMNWVSAAGKGYGRLETDNPLQMD